MFVSAVHEQTTKQTALFEIMTTPLKHISEILPHILHSLFPYVLPQAQV
jgi:hypothetical protein